jgi:thioredoxin-dependent peroxiredoxin
MITPIRRVTIVPIGIFALVMTLAVIGWAEQTHKMQTKNTFAPIQLKPGDAAPGFSLKDQNGHPVRLKDFKGRLLLVYFYPKADTPGCTTQACSVRDHRQGLNKLGLAVVGISPDLPQAQKNFDEKYKLGFPLLSDPDHAIAKAWGVWGEISIQSQKRLGINRSAFLVDKRGKITKVWYGIKPEETAPKAEQALQSQGK